jgi:hypothetical protein
MAVHAGTINTRAELRYLQRNELTPVHQLQNNYYRELIHSYGVDAVYFRHNADAFNEDIPLSGKNFDFIWGEQATIQYWLSADIVVYMASQGDTILLSKFGQETDGDMDAYVLIDDFTENFRDLVGKRDVYSKNDTISATVSSGVVTFVEDVVSTDLSGYTSGTTTFSTSGAVSADFTTSFIRYPKRFSDYMYKCESYTDQVVLGDIYTTLSGTLDENLNGTLVGNVSADLGHYLEESRDGGGTFWKIAPKVGDFFRLDFHDGNHEEYEITRVIDRNLQSEGLNPLLEKYVWHMSCVRRDPSYEDVLGAPDSLLEEYQGTDGSLDEEFTDDKYENSNEKIESISNDELFDYSESIIDKYDGLNSDDIYGEYDID